MGRVVLAPYDPHWADAFAEEAARLAAALGDACVTIHHVGSTSVPGLVAKPRIDMLPVVTSLAALDERRVDVEAAGYSWRGEYGIPGRRLVCRARDDERAPDCNAHAFVEGAAEIGRHLLFRDVLRRDDDVRRRYTELKTQLRDLYGDDSNTYAQAKDPFVDQVLAAAGWTKGRAAGTQPPDPNAADWTRFSQ